MSYADRTQRVVRIVKLIGRQGWNTDYTVLCINALFANRKYMDNTRLRTHFKKKLRLTTVATINNIDVHLHSRQSAEEVVHCCFCRCCSTSIGLAQLRTLAGWTAIHTAPSCEYTQRYRWVWAGRISWPVGMMQLWTSQKDLAGDSYLTPLASGIISTRTPSMCYFLNGPAQ
jgi:hypothetical protein